MFIQTASLQRRGNGKAMSMETQAETLTESLVLRTLTVLPPERSVLAELWEEFSDIDFPCVLADLIGDTRPAGEDSLL